LGGRSFPVAELNLERLACGPILYIVLIAGSFALPHKIEGISGVNADQFTAWRVIDIVLADELETSSVVSRVEANSAFR
jgi:hypothetical protein